MGTMRRPPAVPPPESDPTPDTVPTPKTARTPKPDRTPNPGPTSNPVPTSNAVSRPPGPAKKPSGSAKSPSGPAKKPRGSVRWDARALALRNGLAVSSWIALAWLVLLYVSRPEQRSGLHTYLALGYLLVLWFWLARTKTLSWQSVAALFTVCLPWSVAVGLSTHALARVAGLHVGELGSRTVLAAVGEESLSLLPLLAIALAFPSRVKRFSVTDWLLVGIATGLSFQTIEEFTRLDGPHAHYSLSPISGGLSAPHAAFAGQHLLTGLTAITIGLAVAGWRHSGNPALRPVARNVWRALAVIGPVGCWWLTISVHAGFNATQLVGARWLTAADPSFPWLIRLGWRLGNHGIGLGWLLLVLLVVGLLVDAGRLRNAAEEADDPLPYPFAPTRAADQWAGSLTRWAGTNSSTLITAGVWLIAAGCAVVAYAVRDLIVIVVAHTIDHPEAGPSAAAPPDRLKRPRRESRWSAIARGRAAGVMVRSIRAEAIALVCRTDDRAGWRVSRLFVLSGLAATLLAALWLGPHWAAGVGNSVTSSGSGSGQLGSGRLTSTLPLPWLAGIQTDLTPWWNGLSIWAYGVLGLGFAALMILSAGPLDLPLTAQGGSVMLVRRSARLTGTGRELALAARAYLAISTPTEVAVDAAGLAFGLIPGNLTGDRSGSATGRDVRLAVKDFLADPGSFTARLRDAARRAQQRPVPPLVGPPVRVRTGGDLPPIKLADGRLLSVLSEDDERLFVATLDDLIRGNIRSRNEGAEYQVRIYGDDERLISQRPEKWSDGQNVAYGMVGYTAYYDGRGPTWYVPDTLPETIRHKAYLELDRRLIEFGTVVYYPASPFRALEITTNHPLVAQALEERMARLAIPGYVVLEP